LLKTTTKSTNKKKQGKNSQFEIICTKKKGKISENSTPSSNLESIKVYACLFFAVLLKERGH
jgi:hypothetical protein